jgi:DNA-binding response OmpR family regulator
MKRILITEDDLFLANLCRERFELEGFEVSLAHNGGSAIDVLKSDPPDVVMLDLMLPEIDGIGVLRFLRSQESLRAIPVIVLSNSGYFSGLAQSAWKAGATNFLNKGDHSPKSLVDEVGKLLPAAPPRPAKPARSEPPPQPAPPPPDDFIEAEAGQIRVIVADDDKVIHGVLGFFMEQAGYQVRFAFDGRRAIEMAEAYPPDVMVLDGMMPELDGFEVLEIWRKHPRLAEIPVIMLTSQKSEGQRAAALGGGAVEYITKPFSPDHLVVLIDQYAGKSAARSPGLGRTAD